MTQIPTPKTLSTQGGGTPSTAVPLQLPDLLDIGTLEATPSAPPVSEVLGSPPPGRLSLGSVLSTPSVGTHAGTVSVGGDHSFLHSSDPAVVSSCLAVVGEEKFCVLVDCKYTSHPKRGKFALKPKHIHMTKPSQGFAYCEPCLPESQLMEKDNMKDILAFNGTKLDCESFIAIRNPSTQVKSPPVVETVDELAEDQLLELVKMESLLDSAQASAPIKLGGKSKESRPAPVLSDLDPLLQLSPAKGPPVSTDADAKLSELVLRVRNLELNWKQDGGQGWKDAFRVWEQGLWQ